MNDSGGLKTFGDSGGNIILKSRAQETFASILFCRAQQKQKVPPVLG
jgi:hypothetical protein